MRTRRRNSADIGIAKNDDERIAISEALNLIQADQLINSNDVVVITPNWVQQQTPQTGVVVGPESLREIIRFAKKNNPRRIVVATGSGEKDTAEIMNSMGFDQVIKSEGVEFIDLNKGPFIRVDLNHDSPSSTNLNKLFDEMTFLISFTQLKVHEEATVSASIKNIAMGWPPAEEHGHPKKDKGIHKNLHGFIRAMAQLIPIDLSIVSLNPAMVGTGPSGGIPIHTGIILCGTDAVAVDTIGARLLGFKPQAIYYLYDCINNGIGIGDVNQMNIKGLPLVEAERIFSTAVYRQPVIIDQ
ncbi:Uncharacterized conserved protein, DUF362 family [Caldanaerobius fijiensis DSM 17918]|uniref:Uncharacterized conserved protein, DUF362 family n=1 Tax=Caldanaerobius fijiensis DSM 17918 TaxID=1121256 RepID=A0A1M4ZYA6_9THEO|nr:DUF362 domain-containing protein [Caldanaerobius fijiensis]SHF22998.1 Uncharacterized conserved protein, DUF362 family [Caldanaerobius fijiensis DSM 17918]